MVNLVSSGDFFYLETGSTKTLACGMKVVQKEEQDTQCKWGYLIYGSPSGMSQRIVPLDESPIAWGEKFVDCYTPTGQRYLLGYVNLEVWHRFVRPIVKVAPGTPELRTTEAVQDFLFRANCQT